MERRNDRYISMKFIAMVLLASGATAGHAVPDPTAAILARCLADPVNASTGGQTDCQVAAEKGYDRRMNVAYAGLMRRLPAKAADQARQSQRAWLVFRDAEARARQAIYATRQGTMYVPMQGDAAVSVVGDRARLLERYVRALNIG